MIKASRYILSAFLLLTLVVFFLSWSGPSGQSLTDDVALHWQSVQRSSEASASSRPKGRLSTAQMRHDVYVVFFD